MLLFFVNLKKMLVDVGANLKIKAKQNKNKSLVFYYSENIYIFLVLFFIAVGKFITANFFETRHFCKSAIFLFLKNKSQSK